MERRKEIQMQLEAERQAAENEPPLESIMPTEEYREAEEGEDTSMKAEKQAEPIPPPPPPPARVRKSRFSNPVEFIPPPENPPPPEEDDTVLKEGQGLDNVKIDLGANKGFAFKSGKPGNAPVASAFKGADEDSTDPMYSRKHRPLTKIEKTEVVKTGEGETMKDEARKEGTAMDVENSNAGQPGGEGQASQARAVDDNIKKELEIIISKIPTKKSDLFAWPINWTYMATHNLLEKKVRPWLGTKCVEYIGAEEPAFINMILRKLANRESIYDILKKVEVVLESDAEDFMMKLWRMIIFELLKIEHNLV
eukprot:TRINITY_DN6135_c0_g1_i13.p2 TRINITY_DN6135_c0_g1~~TRINITY_DN6135_c0_g1_i13.p2  ORF type:complete len:309 (+),score=74.29 TRINITY_DN6135_c0_g1_i13:1182-2108(+)